MAEIDPTTTEQVTESMLTDDATCVPTIAKQTQAQKSKAMSLKRVEAVIMRPVVFDEVTGLYDGVSTASIAER